MTHGLNLLTDGAATTRTCLTASAGVLSRVQGWMAQLSQRSPRLVTIGNLGLVIVVGLIDFATGLDVSVSLLYLFPVCLGTWFVGRGDGVLVSLASALAWLAADVLGRSPMSHPLVPLWNAITLAATFAVVAFLLAALKRKNETLEATVMRRTATLRREVAERIEAEERLTKANTALTATREELQRSLADLHYSHRELQSTQIQLIEAAKSESIGRLAAGVAHEVKNPLMTLSLGTDYFINRGSGSPEEAALLQDMKEVVRRSSNIINLLLDFAKPRPVHFQNEDLNALIETSLSLARHQLAAHRVTVFREFQKDLPLVPLDRNRVEHVLVNLLINAAHAMPDGGTLTVRTRVQPAVMTTGGEPSFATVEIEDTGHGISSEHLAKVFEPFFTTKPPGQGTGLGLSIVQKIMQIHGGSISLANRNEGGARATLTFNLLTKEKP